MGRDKEFAMLHETQVNNTKGIVWDGYCQLDNEGKAFVRKEAERNFAFSEKSREWLEGFVTAAITYLAWFQATSSDKTSLFLATHTPVMVLGLGYIMELISEKFEEEVF